jgi:hypothetical protein
MYPELMVVMLLVELEVDTVDEEDVVWGGTQLSGIISGVENE